MYLVNENKLTSAEVFQGQVNSKLLLTWYFNEAAEDAEESYLFFLQELFPRPPS